MRYLKSIIGLVLAALAGLGFAQTKPDRVALVIGNASYKTAPLANPVNDARAMATRLRSLGFDVILRENLKTREIGGTYREFRSKIKPGVTALVFYAGHGIQVRGQNYFPAVDAEIDSEEDVPLQSLNLGTFLENMEESKAGVSLVFLDACRDNPFARRFRSASRGLAKVEAASGTLIHYATKPGSVAADGDGRNGTYTEALLAQLSSPVPVELMLKQVTNAVVTKTKGKQEPWIEGSLRGDFYFTPPVVTADTKPNAVTTVTEMSLRQREDAFWADAKAAGNKEGFDAYLSSYPSGLYASLARANIARLTTVQVVTAPPVTTRPVNTPVVPAPPTSPGATFKDCDDCPEMVVIPAGRFMMGSKRDPFTSGPQPSADEQPQHLVTIKAFAIGKYEVTQEQWYAVMGTQPSRFKGRALPVEQVSWNDAQAFVAKLSEKTGKNYRLPSEAEWEYAARGGSQTNYYFGDNDNDLGRYAWFSGNSGKTTHAVGEKVPNAFGLHDMHGNVWEWTADCWNDSYNGAPSDGSAWTRGSCGLRVLRGGSWNDVPQITRSAFRLRSGTADRDIGSGGFRLARMLP